MRRKPVILMTVASAVLLMLLPALALAAPEAMPPRQVSDLELLKNPGLDGPMWFKSQCCGEDGLPINEVQIADGWTGWWVQIPPSYVVLPENCQIKKVDYGCYWMRPEFVDAVRTGSTNRIYSGNNSQKYFSFGRMHEAGLYQRVSGIVSGTQLHFSVYMSAWMCMDPANCKGGYLSDQPTTMHMRVGIDPTGGTNPFGPNIVWSREVDSFDHWTQYSVEAVAQSESVTVFTHTRPEWMTSRKQNDVYVDEASLKAVGEPGAALTTTPGSSAAPATPASADPPAQAPVPVARQQNTQRPDGTTVHSVQAGDTLFGIALAYGVTVDQIMQLNNLQPGDYLQIGQELIVKGPANPSTPTAAPPPRVPPAAASPQPTVVAAAPAPGGLCVQAFNDRNGNGLYDENEELVANVKFMVMSGDTQTAVYTTSGVDEPHCFAGLPPRAYTVRVEPPKNYVPITDQQMGVALAAGQTANVSFGAQLPGGKATSAGAVDVASLFARYKGALFGLGGVGVLLIAGIVGFIVISRRKS
jgi:LysM repeat protein